MAIRRLSVCVLGGMLLAGARVAAAQPDVSAPAMTDAARSELIQSRVEEASEGLKDNPRLKGLSHEQRKAVVEFVVGNTLFALVHEVGHALISEMGLPVLGREEDAADTYAVLAMLRVGTAYTTTVLADAATGWFMSDKRSRRDKIRLTFYDEHGLDQQRAYEIVCLMVGSDPDKFAEAADKVKMPEDRQESCQGDYSNASWSWNTLLKPHLRAPDQPMQQINTVYGSAEGRPGTLEERLATVAQVFRKVELLETVAAVERERYVWRRPITLEMKTCGEPGAHWDLKTQTITVCYELGLEFATLYYDFGLASPPKALKRRSK